MRILVTNDDGINSIGLHVLARALQPLGETIVAAPDKEYSGASASVGPIPLTTEKHSFDIEGIGEAWAVEGPPALIVFLAGLGAFGEPFDIVVSGINPGANVGIGKDHTLFAKCDGRVSFEKKGKNLRQFVNIDSVS